jgi:nicotinamide riboside transporter PnuC
MTSEHHALNIVYNVNSIFLWALIINSYKNPLKLQRNMEITLVMLHVRNLIRVWDFEKTRGLYEDEHYFVYLSFA